MNAEIAAQLAKYMKEDGLYDTRKIRLDEGASDNEAFFMDIFGGASEEDPEKESPLLAAAKAANKAKMKADEEAALDSNTADSVYDAMMTCDYSRLAEQELVRRANQMRDDERRNLVARLLESIERINAELEANVTTHSRERNRALRLIENMRLGTAFGDFADGSGGVDIAAAYNYVAGVAKKAAAEIETEEELARRGL